MANEMGSHVYLGRDRFDDCLCDVKPAYNVFQLRIVAHTSARTKQVLA
jgi:hypothetical protein